MKQSKFTDSQIIDALKRDKGGVPGAGDLPGIRYQYSDVLQVAREVWRTGCADDVAHEGAGNGERPAQTHVCRGMLSTLI